MGKKKSNSAANMTSNQTILKAVYDDPLRLSDYASAVGTQALFLAFAAIALPQTTLVFQDLPPQKSSNDRPQWEFLAPITAWPSLSIWWICAGGVILQAFWAGRAVSWIKADKKKRSGTNTEYFTVQTIGDSFRVR
jgi:phosphatidylinositol glycan class F